MVAFNKSVVVSLAKEWCVYTANFVSQRRDGVACRHGKKPLRSASVELELVPIFLVSDADIVATPNQRWTSEGPPANPHASRVVIASQIVTHNGVAVGSFWIISKYLARASVG